MTSVKGILLAETMGIGFAAWRKNRDLFSPVKIYLLYTTFFYFEIYESKVRWETLLSYLFLIQSVAVCLLVERKQRKRMAILRYKNPLYIYIIAWLLSLPAFAVMFVFVVKAGGVHQYLLSLAYRVETWKGQGLLVILLNTLPTLNLIYFSALVTDARKSWFSIGCYGLHCIVFVVIGLLTASRSYVAVSLLGMCIIWAYLIKPPKLWYVAMLAAFLVFFAAVIGAARNNNYDSNMVGSGFDNGLGGIKLENAQMGYGVNPLEIVFASPERVKLYGFSYLTVFTNVIPRALWPGKPDTAGIIFTKMYTDDQTGLSYLATGAIAEGVLNFGKPLGAAFGVLFNLLVLLLGCAFYNRLIAKSTAPDGGIRTLWIVAYFYVILTCARFSYGEFTDVVQSLLCFCLIPILIVHLIYNIRLRRSRSLS